MHPSDLINRYNLTIEEQLAFEEYIKNRYADHREATDPDTSFLKPWRGILVYAEQNGAAEAINRLICPKRPVAFHAPETVSMELYSSFTGEIPIIYARNTDDFEQLVISIAYQGVRPDDLSRTGSMFLSGFTTRFIILSAKPYSNVPASELGLNNKMWAEKSLQLRRGHECTHYFTKQTYGMSNQNLHDELIADFIGMIEAFGFFRAEWFLRFMGVIEGGGDRMPFYTKGLSQNVQLALSDLLSASASWLEKWSKTEEFLDLSTADRIRFLCRKGLNMTE